MQGLQSVNSAIDANPALKSAKEQTAKSLSYVSSSVSGWIWGSKNKEPKPKAPASPSEGLDIPVAPQDVKKEPEKEEVVQV